MVFKNSKKVDPEVGGGGLNQLKTLCSIFPLQRWLVELNKFLQRRSSVLVGASVVYERLFQHSKDPKASETHSNQNKNWMIDVRMNFSTVTRDRNKSCWTLMCCLIRIRSPLVITYQNDAWEKRNKVNQLHSGRKCTRWPVWPISYQQKQDSAFQWKNFNDLTRLSFSFLHDWSKDGNEFIEWTPVHRCFLFLDLPSEKIRCPSLYVGRIHLLIDVQLSTMFVRLFLPSSLYLKETILWMSPQILTIFNEKKTDRQSSDDSSSIPGRSFRRSYKEFRRMNNDDIPLLSFSSTTISIVEEEIRRKILEDHSSVIDDGTTSYLCLVDQKSDCVMIKDETEWQMETADSMLTITTLSTRSTKGNDIGKRDVFLRHMRWFTSTRFGIPSSITGEQRFDCLHRSFTLDRKERNEKWFQSLISPLRLNRCRSALDCRSKTLSTNIRSWSVFRERSKREEIWFPTED